MIKRYPLWTGTVEGVPVCLASCHMAGGMTVGTGWLAVCVGDGPWRYFEPQWTSQVKAVFAMRNCSALVDVAKWLGGPDDQD